MKKFVKYFLAFLLLVTIVFFSLGLLFPSFTFENKIEVERPVSHAYAVFENMGYMKSWMPGFKSIDLLSGTPLMKGSSMKVVLVQEGKEYDMIKTLTEVYKDSLFAFTMDNEVLHSD